MLLFFSFRYPKKSLKCKSSNLLDIDNFPKIRTQNYRFASKILILSLKSTLSFDVEWIEFESERRRVLFFCRSVSIVRGHLPPTALMLVLIQSPALSRERVLPAARDSVVWQPFNVCVHVFLLPKRLPSLCR